MQQSPHLKMGAAPWVLQKQQVYSHLRTNGPSIAFSMSATRLSCNVTFLSLGLNLHAALERFKSVPLAPGPRYQLFTGCMLQLLVSLNLCRPVHGAPFRVW